MASGGPSKVSKGDILWFLNEIKDPTRKFFKEQKSENVSNTKNEIIANVVKKVKECKDDIDLKKIFEDVKRMINPKETKLLEIVKGIESDLNNKISNHIKTAGMTSKPSNKYDDAMKEKHLEKHFGSSKPSDKLSENHSRKPKRP